MISPLTLYQNPITVNCIKISLLCDALELTPSIKNLELHKGEQKEPEFLALNPDGKVPVLVEGRSVLTESNAILQYLANRNDSTLWPSHSKAQSEVLKWLFWESNNWRAAVGPLAHRRVVLPFWGFENIQVLSEDHLAPFHRVMADVDHALGENNALVGDDFTIADIGLGSYLMFADEADMPLMEYPNVRRWLKKLRSAPWWQNTYQTLSAYLSAN